jgi:Bacterial regulatory proteins, luxR family
MLHLMARGAGNAEIAKLLDLRPKTIANSVSNILTQLMRPLAAKDSGRRTRLTVGLKVARDIESKTSNGAAGCSCSVNLGKDADVAVTTFHWTSNDLDR